MKYKSRFSKFVEAKNWLPGIFAGIDPKGSKAMQPLYGNVAQKLDYSILDCYVFCVELLEDVNAHDAAAKVNALLYDMAKKEKLIESYKKPERKLLKEGHTSQYKNKEVIKNIYDSLNVMSTNDRSFKKPPFEKIDKTIEVFDDGAFYIVAVGGSPEGYMYANDKIKWYELEK